MSQVISAESATSQCCHHGAAREAVNQGDRRIRLEPTARAARDARRFVAETLIELGHANLIDDATLIVSELTTNSFIHAPNLPIWVGIWETGAFLDVEIWDCSPRPPVYMDPHYLATGGRGLHIVKELAVSTGYTIFDCGKAVWALMEFKKSRAHGISWDRAQPAATAEQLQALADLIRTYPAEAQLLMAALEDGLTLGPMRVMHEDGGRR